MSRPKPTMRPDLMALQRRNHVAPLHLKSRPEPKQEKKKVSKPKWPPSILDTHSKRLLGLSIGDDPLFMIMLGIFHFKVIGCAEELEEDCNSDMIEKC